MTDSESHSSRFKEAAAILAAGFLRLSSRKSSQNLPSEIDLPLGGDVAAEIETSGP